MLLCFFLFILAFMASMLGIVLADNVISLIVFRGVDQRHVFPADRLLHDSAQSRRSALQALLVTSMGGLVMMAGLILLAVAVLYGSGEIVAQAIAAIFFLLLTVPVASHMIGRAAYVTGVKLWSGTVVDELRERYEERDK